MKMTNLNIITASCLAITLAVASPATARGNHGGHGAHGARMGSAHVTGTHFAGGGFRGGGFRRGGGRGIAAGVIAGAALGGGYGYYGGYNSGYFDDSYADMDDYGVVANDQGPMVDDSYCAQRYRSYDPASGTYLGYDGLRHPCQ